MRPLILSLVVLSLTVITAASANDAVTTVILVRHAEKVSADHDPPLSDAGAARARELARVLDGAPIDAIYTTQYLRTRHTAEPLAKARGIEPRVVTAAKGYTAALAETIRRDHAGETVLVVGHSNSTRDLLRDLGAVDPPLIPESQYDDLFVVTLVAGKTSVVPLRYGAVVR